MVKHEAEFDLQIYLDISSSANKQMSVDIIRYMRRPAAKGVWKFCSSESTTTEGAL